MRVLLICSYFPPDSAIAAVRPYMFAKYLLDSGNQVTVLKSGAFYKKPDNSYAKLEGDIRIMSFIGEKSQDKNDNEKTVTREKIKLMIPYSLRKVASKVYHIISGPYQTYSMIRKAKTNYELQKKEINKLANEKFDVVFSTYSELENIWAGEYASKVFGAKWIMDFRDSVVWYHSRWNILWNAYAAIIQKRAIKNASVCTCVSDGLREKLNTTVKNKNIVTLYNGFDVSNSDIIEEECYDQLTFCYTGQFYDLRVNALRSFAKIIKALIEENKIDRHRIQLIYAGSNSDTVFDTLDSLGIGDILIDNGYVDRVNAEALQRKSDVFLVLSWNTNASQGILTGKFYEGIRVHKPILAVVAGNKKNSELNLLNDKYNYGFCYETCRTETEDQLKKYIVSIYNEKMKYGKLNYKANPQLEKDFNYKYLTDKLLNLMR